MVRRYSCGEYPSDESFGKGRVERDKLAANTQRDQKDSSGYVSWKNSGGVYGGELEERIGKMAVDQAETKDQTKDQVGHAIGNTQQRLVWRSRCYCSAREHAREEAFDWRIEAMVMYESDQ